MPPQKSAVWNYFKRSLNGNTVKCTLCDAQLTELELQSYLLDKSDLEKSPLEWWADRETKYPRLSVIAKRVLAVPATSVPSERIFSSAGLIVTKLRNRLSSEVVDQIIFLNKNKIKVPRNEPHTTD